MTEYYNKHYITLDANNFVIGGFSDAFREPSDSDVCINDKGGYQFRLVIDGKPTEENPPLFDGMSIITFYKYINGEVVARSEEEFVADREAWKAEQERLANLPTREDIIEAQTTYTAMMTDTLLPEEDDDDV